LQVSGVRSTVLLMATGWPQPLRRHNAQSQQPWQGSTCRRLVAMRPWFCGRQAKSTPQRTASILGSTSATRCLQSPTTRRRCADPHLPASTLHYQPLPRPVNHVEQSRVVTLHRYGPISVARAKIAGREYLCGVMEGLDRSWFWRDSCAPRSDGPAAHSRPPEVAAGPHASAREIARVGRPATYGPNYLLRVRRVRKPPFFKSCAAGCNPPRTSIIRAQGLSTPCNCRTAPPPAGSRTQRCSATGRGGRRSAGRTKVTRCPRPI